MGAHSENRQYRIQTVIEESDGSLNTLDQIVEGRAYHKPHKQYLSYLETAEGLEGVKTVMSFDGSVLRIVRYTRPQTTLIIEIGVCHEMCYHTPYIDLDMTTEGIAIEWSEQSIGFDYQFSIGGAETEADDVRKASVRIAPI